ncbi:MAG: hypothetical protein FJ288_12850 [Planctomycetes bacterium]|nr:hypothetical protein [Planctomycetota bacterium]
MRSDMSRRTFLAGSLAASAAGAAGLGARSASAAEARAARPEKSAAGQVRPASPPEKSAAPPTAQPAAMPVGKIGKLAVSRMILGGNLLTHYTHSRDLKYVYRLTEHYNTEAKIHETLALAEQHGINTVSMHNPPAPMAVLKKYRKQGGKIQWIICPTAPIEADLKAYTDQVRELVEDCGCEAIYVWGVHADALCAKGKMDLVAKAVEAATEFGVPSGVGCHDLRVVEECERLKVPNDFYIKTFHHHKYPSGPKPEQLQKPYNENPGYWCREPERTIEVMKAVEKPWCAFKVMAAGAIPPQDAFPYVFRNGADHALVGMFDFEIAEDADLIRSAIAAAKDRPRPWRS